MEKLPIEFKKKWVAALRSGQYKQGEGKLFEDNCYCCIGVACMVAGADKTNLDGWGSISEDLRDKVGSIPVELVGYNSLTYALIELNDTVKKSFSEIADYIEENL